MSATGDLARQIATHFLPDPPRHLGVAVSGGGDSVALLCLLQQFCAAQDIRLFAVTVDHGLRAEAAAEARTVAGLCATLDVPHDILQWTDWNGVGNLQSRARDARYRLMSDWARNREISMIALGHTADDQAETFLLRLARRAGVDGLSAMANRVEHHGMIFCRPL
ncbi:MAG: tRNA lysidine(34) synthetase TilS, partial [Sulfitobacter sp.]